MGWWEGIWLNEAFATFMEMLCVDAFRPSWDRWIGFAPSREAALQVDALHLTRPIEYPVGPPKEAEGMFDVLTYEKGCGVLRMLEQHIGPEVFRDGVRTYLKAHAYGNTVTSDLWDALEDASGAPVRDVMDTFILQGGHPLVSLDGNALSQQPFALGPVPDGATSSIGSEWRVPVAVRALAGRRRAGRTGAPPRARCRARVAPRGRAGTGGGQCRRLGHVPRRLRDRTPHGAGRTARRRSPRWSGRTWWPTPGPPPWRAIRRSRTSSSWPPGSATRQNRQPGPPSGPRWLLTRRIASPAHQAALHEAVAALIGPTHRRLGFDATPGENDRTPTLRALAINLLGTVGADPDVLAEAARRFDASPIGGGSGDPIPPDIESATLSVVSQLLRPGDYDTLLERYRNAATPQEEMRSLGALSGFPDVDLCLRTFDLAMTEVRSQNGFAVLGALVANPVGGQAVWTKLTENWDAVLDRFPKNAPPRIVEAIPALCGDADFAEGAIAFLDAHPLPSGPRRVAQSVERLRVNLAFAARERAGLADSLRAARTPTSR